MRGRRTSTEKVAELMAHAAVCDSKSEAGRRAGVPERTARQVIDKYMSDEDFAAVRREKLKELSDKMLTLMIEKMPDASFKDISTAFGIVTDKSLLLDGGATQRVEVATDDAYLDKLAALAGYKRDGQ